ncbi:hypothetical protein ACQ86N_07205 [Puia sp. P3]|uniref:hypothetical protein n=1 Tax=Puia sp. P3 TaxID=3423952 RepID=UPI003D675694
MVDKFLEGAGALGKTDEEIVFESFVLEGSFFYFLHAVDVVVAAADDANDGLSFYIVSEVV